MIEVIQRGRIGTGLISVVAAATTTALFTIPAPSGSNFRAIVRKLIVENRQVGNIVLELGYNTLAAVWTAVLPGFTCLAGITSVWTEPELPIAGNTLHQGFFIDTTAVTGFAGVIAVRASAAAAVPNDVRVSAEIELI